MKFSIIKNKVVVLCAIVVLMGMLTIILMPLIAQAQTGNRVIQADYNSAGKPLDHFFNECVGAGRANEGLRADWQQQLIAVKKECGFRYIRMHGLLTDDMGVYQEDKQGNAIYNWQYIDALYDFLLSIHIKPFVELSFMPSALASNSKTVFWWKGNISYPKDEQKWANLITALVTHFKERYGDKEVRTWYFEVWNEPNLQNIFFTGTREDYFKLYTITANAIAKASPAYKVGGPATAGSAWVPEFIEYCVQHKAPLHFISTHTYGVKSGFVDLDGTTGTILSNNKNAVSDDVIKVHQQITQSDIPGLELHYTEWSSSYTPTDPIHDSYHEAAFMLDKIRKTVGVANSMSYWVFTDIFEENGPRTTPFHGGFGLLNYQGIRKPAFYAYQFLHALGNHELITNDSSSFTCKNDKGNIQVLFWDFTITHPGDSVNDQQYYIRNLPARNKGTVTIQLSHLPDGKYLLKTYKTGYKVNDPYTAYTAMEKPTQLTKQQEAALKKASNGKPISVEEITITKGAFERKISLNENDVILITLNKTP